MIKGGKSYCIVPLRSTVKQVERCRYGLVIENLTEQTTQVWSSAIECLERCPSRAQLAQTFKPPNRSVTVGVSVSHCLIGLVSSGSCLVIQVSDQKHWPTVNCRQTMQPTAAATVRRRVCSS